MYYICVPTLNGVRLDQFIGYSDNYFLYRSYVRFLQENGCGFIHDDIMSYDEGFHHTNDDDFLSEISMILQTNIFYESALRKITSDVTDEFIVIPELIYDKFSEKMYSTTEAQKIISRYVRLTSKSIVLPIMAHLNRNYRHTKCVLDYISAVRSSLDTILPFSQYSTRTMLAYTDRISETKPILYSVIDEYQILSEYASIALWGNVIKPI